MAQDKYIILQLLCNALSHCNNIDRPKSCDTSISCLQCIELLANPSTRTLSTCIPFFGQFDSLVV